MSVISGPTSGNPGKVWDDEDCWVCWCGKTVTPDEIHNTNGVRCWGDK